jgi:hypothetical protein
MPATRILFIGNSYTSRNNLPQLIVRLAASAERAIAVETKAIVAGGASLRRHWNGAVAREAIRTGHWDWVVLQEQSTLPVKNAQRYHENARLFAGEVAAASARLALYLNWERRGAGTQPVLDRAVREIGTELGATVVPVGPAWQLAVEALPGVALYEADGSHPTAAGSYLAACVFYVTLFGGTIAGESVAAALGIDPAAARRLEAIAASAR